ncbi:hypothetical protein DRE_01115 [Drechslerella stenobrocha 248]|uniref:Uncharacterized protein n=1 Tax=Drechslerella stenobrocha 248 TaxID=1043628 RepID=W7HMF0_9PEZI|nr:hypothetical protein DRE_01115 [Drechslerella stenobrocha 248]
MDDTAQNPPPSKRLKHEHHDAETDSDASSSIRSRAETPPPNPQLSAKPVHPVPARSAFSELMAKKAKPAAPPLKPSLPPSSWPPRARNPYYLSNDPRSNLAAYLSNPESLPPSAGILFHNPDFVVVKDAFPKATVHALILPRDIRVTHLHPVEVLSSEPALLASVREIATQARTLLAKELQRIHARSSAMEIARQTAFEALEDRAVTEPGFDPDSEEAMSTLPPHRDWEAAIRIGVHSRPSMSNLHVHLISEDMHSPFLKKKAHYNSFNSWFFVGLDEFPLREDDGRIPGIAGMGDTLKGDMVCWRCQKNFSNKFKQLKEHLEAEHREWIKI